MKRALNPIIRMLMTGLIAVGLIGAAAAQTVPAPGQSPTVDAIKKNGKLRAGVAIAWPWLGQDPKTGKYIGAAADLGQKIADTLGVPGWSLSRPAGTSLSPDCRPSSSNWRWRRCSPRPSAWR